MKKPDLEPKTAPKKGKKKEKTKKSLAEWPKKPFLSWERSRNQVMCRTGKRGAGSSLAIKFKEAGSAKKAWKKAETWLEKTMKEYESFVKA